MSTKSNDELPSIDPTQLSAVTGGVTDTSSTDTLATMMSQVMSSLQDLTQNKGSSSNNMLMEMLPLMMMMRGQSSAAPASYPEEIPPVGNGTGWTLIP